MSGLLICKTAQHNRYPYRYRYRYRYRNRYRHRNRDRNRDHPDRMAAMLIRLGSGQPHLEFILAGP